MVEVANTYVTTRKTPIESAPKESHFQLQTEALPLTLKPGSNEIIVRNLYLSIDPSQLNRMNYYSSSQKAAPCSAAVIPGQAIDAYGIGKVVVSGSPDEFEENDLVVGLVTWGEYSVVEPQGLRKLEPMGFPLSYHLGILGFSGLTAYVGFYEICKPKKGEKVFVSAACGSVGNVVGQYAKLLGCYVVGSVGSREKVALLKEELGFDDAFNYKEEKDLQSTLKRYFPDGIDICFDNVGGEMLEAAVCNMNNFGRVAACGVIAQYTDARKRAAPNMIDVVYKRIKVQGFLVVDYMNLHSDFTSTTCDYIRNGKLKVLEDISDGVDSIPSAFVGLFSGNNVGKKIIRIAEE